MTMKYFVPNCLNRFDKNNESDKQPVEIKELLRYILSVYRIVVDVNILNPFIFAGYYS